MTPHPAVVRTWATLRINGPEIDPVDVTSRLGITPSDSFKEGDQRGTVSGRVWKHGHWTLTSEGSTPSLDLETHIEWLLERLEPVSAQVIELTQQSGVRADIFCYWEFEPYNAGFELEPSLMARIAALNLSLGIDIYTDF